MQNVQLKFSVKTEKELWVSVPLFKKLLPSAFNFCLISSIFWCWKNTQDQSQNKGKAGPNGMLTTFENRNSQEIGSTQVAGKYSYSLSVFPK